MRTNLSSQIVLNQVDPNLYQPTDVFEASRLSRRERIKAEIYQNIHEGSLRVANRIAELIRLRQKTFQHFTLGIGAGQSPIDVYQELVRKHREEGLSFRNVEIFNLFEYYPLSTGQHGTLSELREQLIDHVDILPEHIHAIDGTLDKSQVIAACEAYEHRLHELGGLDFQLLGIGRGGNIGFNEPGTQINSLTRLVILDNVSRNDAVDMFGSIDNVPISAITMGIGTILSAREIMLVAWGEHKSEMIKQAIEEEQSLSCPASTLQSHANATMILDLASASRLTRLSEPWLLTSCEWTDQLTRRAIVRLCQQTGKPVLKLTTKDYVEHGLSELITKYESAYNCNIKIFNDLQHTITGWPGGKPDADDSHRPERAQPYPKRILIFSPHPDDDVISMGATFHRLIEQGHECHVAYETSGNIAVDDDEIIRFMDFVKGYTQLQQQDHTETITKDYNRIIRYLTQEKNDNVDTREVLDLKALLRRGEATAACRHMGLPKERIHFLNLPFYETGRVKKGDLTDKDVHIVKQLLQKLQPHQIYAAGDLADPHGTHKVCLDAVLAAIDELKDEPWLKECRIWMYRGAWMEWDIDQIEMAVPISPEQLRFKRNTILKHQSQMESAPFLGNDERLFWQRAEDRNRATAELYARLGLASYEAIEAFVQYHPI